MNIIPAYAFNQYADDDNIVALFEAYNKVAQYYLDWFNSTNLPIYTGLQGPLLDWVAQGLYGQSRPTLASAISFNLGPVNTFRPKQMYTSGTTNLPFLVNSFVKKYAGTYYLTSDDLFKRILTWNYYKGDGFVFNPRWLKRRVMRFLIGVNGTDPGINQTYRISVTYSGRNTINIQIQHGKLTINGGSMANACRPNAIKCNTNTVTYVSYGTNFPMAKSFQDAFNAGVLNLPFQYNYTVAI